MTKTHNLRIVFMGTPDFAVATLKALLNHDYNVVGVVTAPDRKAGRGQKLASSAVKEFAVSHKLNVLQPKNLKAPSFIKTLKTLNANLQIVVAFRMLPKIVWQMPKYGTFNLHASLLPQYRGAAPIHWAIINGEKQTGVTTFFIDEKIDTGATILKAEIDISNTTTAGELHDELMILGSVLVIKTVELIDNNSVKTTLQSTSTDLKTAYKLNRENCKIDWNQNLNSIYNKIRGLNPYPAAWCYLDNITESQVPVKIFQVEKVEQLHHWESGYIIIENSEMKVACQNGFIKIEEFQLPGKRKMDTKALLNGFKFSKNAKLL